MPVNEVSVKTQSRLEHALEFAQSEISRIENRIEIIRWFQRNIEPLVPEGINLGDSYYDYYGKEYVELTIPEVEGREWAGLNGTAGLIFKARKAFNVGKFNRSVHAYGESVSNTYSGTGSIMVDGEDEERSIEVYLKLGSQLPPTCKIEWEEVVTTRTEKVGKVTCD